MRFLRRLFPILASLGLLIPTTSVFALTNREAICDPSRACFSSGVTCAAGSTCNTLPVTISACTITTEGQGRCVSAAEQTCLANDPDCMSKPQITPPRQVERSVCCRCGTGGSRSKCVTFTNAASCASTVIDRHPSMVAYTSVRPASDPIVTCDEEVVPDAQCLSVVNQGACPNTPADIATVFQTPAGPSVSDQVSNALTQAVRPPITPNLNVPIPGLSFATAEKVGGTVRVSFIGQYISAVYRYLVTTVLVVATIMVVYGGFLYLVGPVTGKQDKGKTIIKDALIGMVLVLSAYLILQTVNPRLTNLEALKLESIIATEYGEGEGQTEAPRDMSSGACGDLPQLSSIPPDRMIAVPRYYQFQSPWGSQPYGRNLVGETGVTACQSAAAQNAQCTGTFTQGACGVTALASVLGYYNVQGANGRITPLDTAIYAVQNGFRPHNGGTTPAAICSDAFRRQYPGFFCESLGGNAVRAAQALRQRQPLVFHCARCNVTTRSGQPGFGSRGDGHYMVLTGVSDDGQTFAIHDVGHADGTAAVAISATELSRQAIWLIRPSTGPAAPSTVTGAGTAASTPVANVAAPSGNCAPVGGQSAITATSGSLSIDKFAYRPNGNAGWVHPGSPLVYPTRLANQAGTAHLFIFLHGLNTDAHTFETSGYWREIRPELERVAGSRNIIFVAPHFQAGANYYSGFNFNSFYAAATAAIAANPATRQLRIDRIVIGGHSAATCQGSPVPLRDALRNKPANTVGIVAYDGCLGTELTMGNYSSPGSLMFFNPDLSGMGIDRDANPYVNRYQLTRDSYRLLPHVCPPYVGAGVGCFKHATENWWSFETRLGHAESVQEMTKYSIQAFIPVKAP